MTDFFLSFFFVCVFVAWMGDAQANEEEQKRAQFREFLKTYTRQARGGFLYREAIRRHNLLNQRWLQVDFDDIRAFDREHEHHLANDLLNAPTSSLRIVCYLSLQRESLVCLSFYLFHMYNSLKKW